MATEFDQLLAGVGEAGLQVEVLQQKQRQVLKSLSHQGDRIRLLESDRRNLHTNLGQIQVAPVVSLGEYREIIQNLTVSGECGRDCTARLQVLEQDLKRVSAELDQGLKLFRALGEQLQRSYGKLLQFPGRGPDDASGTAEPDPDGAGFCEPEAV